VSRSGVEKRLLRHGVLHSEKERRKGELWPDTNRRLGMAPYQYRRRRVPGCSYDQARGPLTRFASVTSPVRWAEADRGLGMTGPRVRLPDIDAYEPPPISRRRHGPWRRLAAHPAPPVTPPGPLAPRPAMPSPTCAPSSTWSMSSSSGGAGPGHTTTDDPVRQRQLLEASEPSIGRCGGAATRPSPALPLPRTKHPTQLITKSDWGRGSWSGRGLSRVVCCAGVGGRPAWRTAASSCTRPDLTLSP
jgi:hypothetical protein